MLNRREFLLRSALLGSAAIMPSAFLKLLQEDPFKTLRRNVGTFTGQGGTIGWLVNKDAVVVIDSQFPQSAALCIKGLKERSALEFDYLLNTHHHGDHTGGNATFKPVVKNIVAHENVPKLQLAAAQRQGQEAVDRQAFADITFKDTWKADAGDEVVHMKYYGPGHTSGDAVIYFEKANVAHMGDLMFNRAHPFIDRGSGASMSNWSDLLTKVSSDLESDTLYIFGHGNSDYGITGSKEDLQKLSDFLAAALDYVQKGIAAGKSKEEILKKETLPGFEEFKAPGWRLQLSANLDVAYQELTES